jgi:tRNA 2-selenouridine synthase
LMHKIKIDEFIALAGQYPVLDVRSPGEYIHAHMPGAYSLPLFSDEERKVVGTLYKQQGRQDAIKTGLEYFGVKMRAMVEEVEAIIKAHKPKHNHPGNTLNADSILVHCWRGGMRSAGVAWLLDLYGFKVYTLAGGYKAYRNYVLQQFEKPCPFNVLGGYTGSAKTEILKHMAAAKHPVIDLEGIAHHKGSAFGALGEAAQPGQEMFENLLAEALSNISARLPPDGRIWVEDESRRIGLVNLPDALWKTLQRAQVYFIDIPFEERLDYLTQEYGKFKKEDLVNAVMRIRKKLGGQNAKNAINYLLEDNCKESFRILLHYYDKFYGISLVNKEKEFNLPRRSIAAHMNVKENYRKIIEENSKHGSTDK